jgi:2-C-methyl-D-erythritol 2,4-cyclodiphosphate synthase
MEVRTGFGFDSHKLAKGRKLILGGVEIESDYGLLGFSDADLLIHSLCDALLAAMGERDLGEHFSDQAEENRGRSSLEFLEFVKNLMQSQGYSISYLDLTVILEKPILAPYKEKIKSNLAELLSISPQKVSLKAKRPEGAFSEDVAVCFALATLHQN